MARRPAITLAQRAAREGGIEAHSRYVLARRLRRSATDFELLDQPRNATTLRRLAANLDAQRRRIMKRRKP